VVRAVLLAANQDAGVLFRGSSSSSSCDVRRRQRLHDEANADSSRQKNRLQDSLKVGLVVRAVLLAADQDAGVLLWQQQQQW
jgi:hypothetical protein